MNIQIICIGKLKEKYWTEAIQEYAKRLSRFCTLEIVDLKEARLPDKASAAEEALVKQEEGREILKAERQRSVSDTIMVGLITMSIIIFNFDFFHSFFAKNPALLDGFQSMFNSIWIYVAGVIFIAGIWFIFTYMSNFTLVKKAKSMLQNIWDGMKSIWLMKRKGLFVIQTLLIWTGYFLYFYITFYAFDFTRDLGVTVGLIAFTMSSIAVAVPVQGGIGPWQLMVIATLMCFGVKETDAAAFALVVHTVHTAWLGITGLFGVVALPFVNKGIDNGQLTIDN